MFMDKTQNKSENVIVSDQLKRPKFRNKKIWSMFALVFVVAGGYALLRYSFAATPLVTNVQAERMVLPSGSSIVNDSSASGGQAVKMTEDGALRASFTVPTGSKVSSLEVAAKSTNCSGFANVKVVVDGNTKIPTTSVSATSWSIYKTNLTLNPGKHTLRIRGSNIAKAGTCQRNLWVDVANFYGSLPVTAPPSIAFSASPTSITSGSSSTLTWSSTNTTSCTASGAWAGSEPTHGSAGTGALSASSTYTLTCSGAGGEAKASVTVTVQTQTGGGGSGSGGSGGTSGSWWKPTSSAPISWNWVIGKAPSSPYKKVAVYDIDGFDNSASTVQALHAQGSKVICYIDVGTYEPGRSDVMADPTLIPLSDRGNGVQGWPGEKWLNIADIQGLTRMVKGRMQMCASKGFDAIEPDNIDGYTNSTGFSLTAADQIAYNKFLASTAHGLGLSIGLKNDVDQTSQLAPYFDWALNEECNKYSECSTMTPFTSANKAVFNAEYKEDGETTAKFCAKDAAAHINGVLFGLDLNEAVYEPCTQTW